MGIGMSPAEPSLGKAVSVQVNAQHSTPILHPLVPQSSPSPGWESPTEKNLQALYDLQNGGQNVNISLGYERMKPLPAPWCG